MSAIRDEFNNTLITALESKTLTRCSRWAKKNRVMGEPFPGPFGFDYHPWLLQIHDDMTETVVIMKGAQLGLTEFAINKALFTLDQLKRNVLYALPNQIPDALNFSKGRLNTATEASAYLANLFSKSKSESHKITRDGANLYIRGARSRVGFKQVDVSLVVLDELDEMTDEAVGLARYRISGQPPGKKQIVMLSTPSIEGRGISAQFEDTSQNHFFFKCPYCSKHIRFEYPGSVIIYGESITDPDLYKSHYICTECKHKLEQHEKKAFLSTGKWVPLYPSRPIQGYHINQLYSYAFTPSDLAQAELRGRYNVAEKTEFYNSTLGLTFVADGAKITDDDIDQCIKTKDFYNNDLKQAKDRMITMGIDVGASVHHVSIVGWQFDPTLNTRDITTASIGQLLYFGEINSFDEIEKLMFMWKPVRVVIDAQPEQKSAVEVCKKFQGIAFVCFYSLAKNSRQIVMGNVNECSISVNRNFWLDVTTSKIRQKMMLLPRDLNLEYREHLKCLVKTYKKDKKTEDVYAEFVKKDSAQDHYTHSLNYATIAMALTAGSGQSESI